jgi:hypothetical protein
MLYLEHVLLGDPTNSVILFADRTLRFAGMLAIKARGGEIILGLDGLEP